ncbi:hypothetical protein Ciccas_013873 [Cichlidogyrus casuarinus]|uniref:Uncharacterized protein n=1 Tax=Cichlidogyrus casuarinus TaxID=1844966 RepID=A0ABD2PJH7_9PLAT
MHFLMIEGKQVEVKAMEPQTPARSTQSFLMTPTSRFFQQQQSLRPMRHKYGLSEPFYGWNQWSTSANSYPNSAAAPAAAFHHHNGSLNSSIWTSQGASWPDSSAFEQHHQHPHSSWNGNTESHHNGWSAAPSVVPGAVAGGGGKGRDVGASGDGGGSQLGGEWRNEFAATFCDPGGTGNVVEEQ